MKVATAEEPISINRCHERLPDTILRFVAAERLLHWAIAIPFLGCFASAVVLVVAYNPDPTRAYRQLFAWMHRVCGAGLILCPSVVLLASVRRWRIHLYNVRQAWIWAFDDIKWLALMGPAAVSKRIVLPDQGKFNAAEKLNFMMVMVCPPLLMASGVLIWFPESTKFGAFGPWLVHCCLAALATPLVLGHMIMATINPSTRVGLKGMFTGLVSREWAAHHYARWFREQFPDLAQESLRESTDEDAGVTEQTSVSPEIWPQPAAADQIPFAEDEFDAVPCLLASSVTDAVPKIQPGLALNGAEEIPLPARNDARAGPDVAGGADSSDAVTAGPHDWSFSLWPVLHIPLFFTSFLSGGMHVIAAMYQC